jgi:hypothetical protein
LLDEQAALDVRVDKLYTIFCCAQTFLCIHLLFAVARRRLDSDALDNGFRATAKSATNRRQRVDGPNRMLHNRQK